MEITDLRDEEKRKYEIIAKAVNEGLDYVVKKRAQTAIGCSSKTLEKYIENVKQGNIEAFSHKNKGRLPVTALTEKQRTFIRDLYVEKYNDASFQHFTDILKEDHNISICDTTLHNILKPHLIVSPASTHNTKKVFAKLARKQLLKETNSKKEVQKLMETCSMIDREFAHPHRVRSKYFGELIQMDASEKYWISNEKWHLHVAIDDATSEIVGAAFDTQETLKGYYMTLYMVLKTYGIPLKFFTDKRTVFEYKRLNDPDPANDTFTQFQNACNKLGIAIQTSSIPENKGRVERLNRTLQGRLPIDLRRKGITTIEEANAYLPTYIKEINSKFSVKTEEDENGKNIFSECPSDEELNNILAVITDRVIDKGHCIKFKNKYYLPYKRGCEAPTYFLAHTKASLIQTFDGNYSALIKGTMYDLKVVEQRREVSKDFDIEQANTTLKERKCNKPEGYENNFLFKKNYKPLPIPKRSL